MPDIIQELQMYLASGKYQEACARIESLPEDKQNTVEIQNLMGLSYFYQGEYGAAQQSFEAVLTHNPTDEDCIYNLAYILYQQRETEQLRHLTEKLESAAISIRLRDQLNMWLYELSSSAGKKLLMIAYYYPPLSGSGVFRSLKFSKYLGCYGWKPTVISAKEPPDGWKFRDDSQLQEIPKDIQVIRIDDIVSCNRGGRLSVKNFLSLQEAVLRYNPLLASFYQQQVAQGEPGIRTLLNFPMHDAWWAGEVIQYLEKNVDLSQYDAVYTTTGPHTAHLVGFYLQKKHNMPWIADYRDPWTGNPYSNWDHNSGEYKVYYTLERMLLQHADINIIVDNRVAEYEENFQVPENKITVITNGYDEEDFQTLRFSQEKTPQFTITYSGLLYTEGRNVSPIFEALSELIESKKIDPKLVSFLAVGSGDQNVNQLAQQYNLCGIIHTTGYISHHDALQYNVDSNLLLLLVGDKPEYREVHTGKIFDYLRSGKPILAIAPSPSVVEETLQKVGHGYVVQSKDKERIKDIILQEYTAWIHSSENIYLQSPLIEQFERKYLTGKLAMTLDKACVQHSKNSPPETSSDIYNQIYRTGGAGQAYHKHYTQSFYYPCWQQAMRYFYLLDRNAKILEVGCGAGQFANMLFDAGFWNYHGLDYAEEAIKLARNANIKHKDKFFVADAFQHPILEEQHDLVIFFEILEHIQDDIKLLSRLPDGSKVLLSVPNFKDPTHVRCFDTVQAVENRYKEILCIQDIQQVQVGQTPNILFYLLGEIKHRNLELSIQPTACVQLKPYQKSVLESDKSFKQLVNVVKQATSLQLEKIMVTNFKKQSENFRSFVDKVTHSYPIRGVVDAATGKGTMVTDRIQCLKEHIADFEWLYNRLADHRSRAVLYSILAHWLTYEPALIKRVQEPLFADYFDLDVMPLDENEVIVDLGMYTGDTVLAYQNVCKQYKKWYCYEVDERNIPTAMKNLNGLQNIEIRCKAVCDKNGYVYMNMHADSSSNIVGKGNVKVPAVTLDEDIKEPITLIKMDIEGSEQSALRGCINHIKNEKPKLAICTYHGNYDIWQIPRLIDSIRDDYKFYMRYNGTDLAIPREYVLIAI